MSRARLLLNLGAFQLKLIADGLRDVVLFPLAFLATVYGLVFASSEPDYYFRKLLKFGRRTDRFINLFNQHTEDTDAEVDQEIVTADDLLAPYQDQLLDKLAPNDKPPES